MSLNAPGLDYLIRTFHPGYMNSPEPDTLPRGATPDAKNCLLGSMQPQGSYVPGEQPQQHARATLQKRSGCRMLTTAQVVAGKGFDGLVEFRTVGQSTGRLVAVVDGKVWYWDAISAFVQIGATAPFVSGTKVTFSTQRNLLFIMDGLTTRCWDGGLANDLFTPGQIAPTGAGALTDGGAAGSAIPNATYEGFQVWYDSTHDRETSPGPLTTQVVITAGHQRTWAKPTGAPGANYDKWRAYCRSVTANETYFKRVLEVAIATASASESLSDAARNLQTLGPLPQTNDPPPLGFVLQGEFQGYRLGVLQNDDQVYVSKLGDPQAQSPSDILGVSRGVGGEIRSIVKFGTACVVQKAGRSYVLDGDRMPFVPREVNPTLGNVGPSSAVAIKGQLFAWDEEKGPYWTDLAANWQPIGIGRIQQTIAAVPKTFAKAIEAVHVKALDLVVWSLPATVNGRRRTLLAYHTEFGAWLPPITGLEYAATATFLGADGTTNFYVGDYWGRLYQYFTDFVEGVPSGSLVARVLSQTSGTVTCDVEMAEAADGSYAATANAVNFYTTGAGLTGLPVLHIAAASGARQWRRIQSNTASVLTLDTTNDAPWAVPPVAGDQIVVGGIDWYWRSPVIDFGDPFTKKRGGFFAVQARKGSGSFRILLTGLMEGLSTTGFRRNVALTNSSAWGVGSWGSMLWGGGDPEGVKSRLMRAFFGFAFELSNPYPNNPITILSARVTADPIGARKVRSGGADI